MLSPAFPALLVEAELFEHISAKSNPMCAKSSFSRILRLGLGLYEVFLKCIAPILFPYNSKNNVSTSKA